MGFQEKTEYIHIAIWKWETNSITCLNALTLMIYENACLLYLLSCTEQSQVRVVNECAERSRSGKPVYIREKYYKKF